MGAALPPLANLQAFEAVARRRSFSMAAAELNLTPSAVSHQVARLESHLGVRLFDRSAHGVRISAAGEHYRERVAGALAAIASATDDVRQGGLSNSLYVHAAPTLASLWLMPRLKRFAQAHPDISLNLSAAHTHSDFALGQADLDIRYGVPSSWGDLVVEPLFEERVLPLASPAFVREHRLHRVEQLLEVPLIQSNVSVVQWVDWLQRFARRSGPDRFALRFDRAQMSLDAATQGLGVALESATNAEQHLADGRLMAPFGRTRAIAVKAHFVVYPARHARRPAVEAFVAWIHGEAAPGRARARPVRAGDRAPGRSSTARSSR